MKFRAHDTFFIRKGWLSKGLRCVSETPDVFVSKTENPMDVLGIGANMVKALRYWLQATGLTVEPTSGRRNQSFTELGKLIYKYDRYLEELGTLFLIHYKLACNKDTATSWYYFFNEFSINEFTKEIFVEEIEKYIKMQDEELDVANRSLNDDFNCIINTYLTKNISSTKNISPENNIECPMRELGLIEYFNKNKKTYKKVTPNPDSINPLIAMAVIADNSNGKKEISLNELLTSSCNIGRIFNLDSIAMLEILYKIERLGLIKINRTAGLDVINISEDGDFLDFTKKYYSSISK